MYDIFFTIIFGKWNSWGLSDLWAEPKEFSLSADAKNSIFLGILEVRHLRNLLCSEDAKRSEEEGVCRTLTFANE